MAESRGYEDLEPRRHMIVERSNAEKLNLAQSQKKRGRGGGGLGCMADRACLA